MATNNQRSQGGFTLIELLIVVVVIGVLAGIAIPKFSNTKGKAYTSAMMADLRNLNSAQEAFFSDSNRYYSGSVPTTGFMSQPSLAVTLSLQNVSAAGWAGVAITARPPRSARSTRDRGTTGAGDERRRCRCARRDRGLNETSCAPSDKDRRARA
jgi:prepilin-type N-terminal cleavage/methylation domain-containing protein